MTRQDIVECPNCKRFNRWGHFVPPSLGEQGFWICKQSWATDDNDPEVERMNKKYNRPIPHTEEL